MPLRAVGVVNHKTKSIMKYNPQIHHRRSIRLQGYDYSQAGLYFITICCQDRVCLFGEIVGAENLLPNNKPKMILNDAGKIADECWMAIPKHFPNAVLHEHIVMPNHVHGIIELIGAENVGAENVGAENVGAENVGAENFLPLPETKQNDMHHVGVENFQPLPNNEPKQNEFQKMIPRSIVSIVKGFKIGVTIGTKNILADMKIWQRNYHEHIIRNEQSYQTISNYIINNAAKWKEDKFYNQ